MREINVGDLVMVVKALPCCGWTGGIGDMFYVAEIFLTDGQCDKCGNITEEACANPAIDENGYPLTVLKKIPPLTEPESITTDEGITA